MPITDLLRRNAREFGEDTALVEINPEHAQKRRVTWKEYELIEPANAPCYRREITWREFDEHANRFANLLLSRGLGKGKKVAILLMNCLEWLPIYFGILKAGALAVPLNFRYTADEIDYCMHLAEADALVFGPEIYRPRGGAGPDAGTVLPAVLCGQYLPHLCRELSAAVRAGRKHRSHDPRIRAGRRGDLLFLRHHGLSKSHPAQP